MKRLGICAQMVHEEDVSGPLLSRRQVARLFFVSPSVVDYYVDRGMLDAVWSRRTRAVVGYEIDAVLSSRDAFGLGSRRRSILSRRQVARLLRVSPSVVGWYVKTGKLSPIRATFGGSIVGFDTDDVLTARDKYCLGARRGCVA